FFFQPEDGIRDRNVTGVQTCALPISGVAALRRRARPEHACSLIDRVHRSGVSDPREVFARAGAPARFRVGSIVKDGRRGRPRPRGKEDLMVVTALTPAVLRSTPTC